MHQVSPIVIERQMSLLKAIVRTRGKMAELPVRPQFESVTSTRSTHVRVFLSNHHDTIYPLYSTYNSSELLTIQIKITRKRRTTTTMSLLSSTLTTVSNHLKPHKAEAVQRIRMNTLCLLATLVLSYLLPVPSIFSAVRALLSSSQNQRWSAEWAWEWIGVLGAFLLICGLFFCSFSPDRAESCVHHGLQHSGSFICY